MPTAAGLAATHGEDRALAAVSGASARPSPTPARSINDSPRLAARGAGHLAAIAERIDWAMLSLVGEARAHVVSWSAIGASLGVTKQAAQQRFAPYVKQALEQAKT